MTDIGTHTWHLSKSGDAWAIHSCRHCPAELTSTANGLVQTNGPEVCPAYEARAVAPVEMGGRA